MFFFFVSVVTSSCPCVLRATPESAPPTGPCWVCAGPELWEHETSSECQKSCTETWLKCIYLTARLNWLMTPVFTSEGAAAHWTDSLVCGLPCCSRHTWPAPRRRPGGLLSLEGSRCHHLRCPPSPAGRRAAVWRPGLTPPTHPRGRTWHGT